MHAWQVQVQVHVQVQEQGGGGTWHADKRLAVDFVEAALPVDLAQVVAGAGVGVARVDHLLHDVAAYRTWSWN